MCWEVEIFCSVRLRTLLVGGARRGVYAFRKCRLIPPHQSLTRQLPPKGKPSVRCANRVNMTLSCGSPLRSALIALLCSTKGLLQKRLPLGGKLSRKRLMRGDKSAPTQRLQSLTHPTHKKSATAALCKKSPPPQTQKNFPHDPATTKSESNLRSVNGGVMGEVLGRSGRFGG